MTNFGERCKMTGCRGLSVQFSLLFLCLNFCSFCVLVAALSALQHNSGKITPLLNEASGLLAYGDLAPRTINRRLLSYEWFKVFLLFVIALFSLVMIGAGQCHRFRIAIVGLLAVLTTLFCDSCQTFYYLRTQVDAIEGSTGKAIAMQVRTFWAGCIMTAALSFALIISVGSGLSEDHPVTSSATTSKGASNGVGNENPPAAV